MVIQCPACQTKFRIADEKVAAGGVQVRCSKCSNTFPVKREDGESTGSFAAASAPPTGAVTTVSQPPPAEPVPEAPTAAAPPRPVPKAPTLTMSSDPPAFI